MATSEPDRFPKLRAASPEGARRNGTTVLFRDVYHHARKHLRLTSSSGADLDDGAFEQFKGLPNERIVL